MPAPPPTIPDSPPKARSNTAAWLAVTILGLAALALVGALKIANPAISLAKALPAIAEKFKTGTITSTFAESIPEVISSQGDILELATSRSTEFFRREDSKSILWNRMDLGTTISEIRAPVTFRYHLRLSDPWQLATRDKVCIVEAPRIRPSLPPAIHTELMEKNTVNGWARFNKDDNLELLERSMTPTLETRAANPAHLRLAREACRQSVAEFVKNWLMQKEQWSSDRFNAIIVVFPDEKPADQKLERVKAEPVLKITE